ncbi:MAG: single-stranded DNA-binding protein, partial [Mogibacterium sp.]|nr:single-stranded DNA-binding protein [Mogibacterium sp.]
MRDLNSVIITGRVGQNIELKTTGNGKYVVNFNLAVQNDDTTNWIRCVAWEKTAEALNKYAHKGD